ncbi:DUF6518 family protein [Nocardiopsis lambiniae]|uniref:DUF6518 family protein n=1 Tax=Nocardiopsis lambiniae TaxID=3075539 RepID=A0ABU2MAY6_9ACTN|nr:DUF6518 family protein [Nocardiopsis sp. DSM 44743]MDT0329843.1 DUF6518 family protein [Nocardiopsis sp. DSM 44743]
MSVETESDRETPGRTFPLWALFLLAGTGGLIIGIATILAQGLLPDAVAWPANSGAVWAAAAFVAGAVGAAARPWECAVAGLLTQWGAVIGYYGGTSLMWLGAQDLWAPLVWMAAGAVSGPLFGLAGAVWRKRDGWWRAGAIALLGAVLAAEGVFKLVNHEHFTHMMGTAWTQTLLGPAVPLLLGDGWKGRARALAVLAALIPLGVGVHVLADLAIASG